MSKVQRFASFFAVASLCVSLAALILPYGYIVRPAERQHQAVQTWLEHAYEVITAIHAVEANINDAEIYQRGFLLTDDVSYLDPYEHSVETIWHQFSRLQALTFENKTQQDRLQVLHAQLQARLSELADTIALARHGDDKAARDIVRGSQARPRMDAVRTTIASMAAEEERLLQAGLLEHQRLQLAAGDADHALVILGIVGTLMSSLATMSVIWIASARSTAAEAERLRLLNMLDLAPIMMRDFDGTIRFWSKGCHNLFGWTAEEAIGQLAHELLRIEFPVSRSEINADLLQKREWAGELRGQTRNGTRVIVFARKLLGENIDGFGFGVMETVTDITELRKFEADLQSSEARLKFFVENAPAGIAMFDTEMRYLAVSNRFLRDAQINDQTPADMIGCSYYAVFSAIPDHRRELHRRVLAGESLSADAEALQRTDGSIGWMRWEMNPWRNPDGSVGGLMLCMEDMTEHRNAEAALRENEMRLRLVQKVGGVAYYDRRLAEDVATISEECTRIFNLPPHQTRLRLSEALAMVHPDDRGWFASAAQHAIANGGKIAGECRLVLPDGALRRISIQFEIFPGPDSQPYRVIAALRDVTEIVTAREVLAAQRDELKRSNTDLEEFTYAISHDLKAPLRAIGHLAEWISEDMKDTATPATAENLRLLRGRVVRMQNLLEGLLEYSRIGRTTHTTEDVAIADLISDIVAMHAVQPDFAVTYEGEITLLRTQRVALQVVLHNLIGNAVKHHDRPNGRIVVSSRFVDGLAEFRVSDDGPGIAETFHQRIFGIFQTLQSRDTHEASGIGLAIVKRKVEKHGGRIWVESAPPVRGSTFVFTWKPTPV